MKGGSDLAGEWRRVVCGLDLRAVLKLPVTLTPGVASSGCSSSDGLPLIEPELLLLWVSCID